MLALCVSSLAFAPQVPFAAPVPTCARTSVPCATLSSRRQAIAGAALFGLAATPLAAQAANYNADLQQSFDAPTDTLTSATEDSIARIAAKNKIAQEKEKEKQKLKLAKNSNKVEKENAGSNAIVGVIALASVGLSLPFFYKNVARLFLRWRSVVDSSITEDQFSKTSSAKPGKTIRAESRESRRGLPSKR